MRRKVSEQVGAQDGGARGEHQARATLETPLGPMMLVATAGGLALARFDGEVPATPEAIPEPMPPAPARSGASGPDETLEIAVEAMMAYFSRDGEVDVLPPFDLHGTALQVEVWRALLDIPVGVTRTYRDIARAVGRPRAVRAIGAAIGANPVGVLVPCHRVIGADGSLTGYAGGLERKRWLLAHEGAALAV